MNLNSQRVSVILLQSLQLLARKTSRVMASQKNYESLLSASDKWFNRYEENAPVKGIFSGVRDRFNGITVDSQAETCDEGHFDSLLSQSLDTWTEQKKRAIWFKVHRDQAGWVPVLAKQGFNFHHAREEFVMMYRWLPKNEQITVPPFAHTMVGVGALVINERNEVLAVSERNALIPNSWKLPGGYCEMTEDIVDAAIREVEEETNIKTKFESIISVRHAHSAAFGCSDLYFIMKLIPLTENIIKCEREIADCKWMPMQEYMNHENVHETNRSFVNHWLELKQKGMLMDVVTKTHEKLQRKYQIFFPKSTDSGSSKI